MPTPKLCSHTPRAPTKARPPKVNFGTGVNPMTSSSKRRLSKPAAFAAVLASVSKAPVPALPYHSLVCGSVISGVTVVTKLSVLYERSTKNWFTPSHIWLAGDSLIGSVGSSGKIKRMNKIVRRPCVYRSTVPGGGLVGFGLPPVSPSKPVALSAAASCPLRCIASDRLQTGRSLPPISTGVAFPITDWPPMLHIRYARIFPPPIPACASHHPHT